MYCYIIDDVQTKKSATTSVQITQTQPEDVTNGNTMLENSEKQKSDMAGDSDHQNEVETGQKY